MEMIAHQTKCQDCDIKPKHAHRDIIHPLNKIFPTLKDVISLQSMTTHMIVIFPHNRFLSLIPNQQHSSFVFQIST